MRGTTAVNGFTFTNGTINNSGTGGGNQESSIAFNDPTGSATDAKVTGTVTITGNTLTNALWHGVSILQFAGALDEPPDGAVLVFATDDQSIPEEFARNDPYVKAGIVASWKVRRWNVVVGDGAA